MKYKTVKELHPRRYSSHKLTKDNALNGIMPAISVVLERGQFFNKIGWRLWDGWELKGWSTPPYPREGGQQAIVFEKTTPASETGDFCDRLEPGLYWLHDHPHSVRIIV